MGLLDALLNPTPEQRSGLLAASAALARAGAPSLVPTSGAVGLSNALQAYEQGVQSYQDRQQQKALYDLKLRSLLGELSDKDKARNDAQAAQDWLKNYNSPGQRDATAPARNVLGADLSPTVGNASKLEAAWGGSMPPAAPHADAPDLFNQRISQAAAMRSSGNPILIAQADKLEEQALKFRDEYSTDFRVAQGEDGKLHNYVLSKFGGIKDTGLGVAPNLTEVDLGGSKRFVDKNSVPPGTTFQKTMTFADQNAAARLRFDQQQASAGDDATGFTSQAIDNAAARYNIDGTLPPMGMGKAGTAGRTKILNRAAELQAGVDPSQQRFDQLNNKGDVAARNASVRSFATGKDGQAVQSANTALNHLDTIQQLAQAQKSGDVRAFNQAARSLGAAFGQTAPTNLNAALIMVAPEISKAVVGAGGTGHERDQALQALNPNGSPDQILGATQTMQELFGGRLTEAKRTYERTTMKKDFDTAMLSPAAQKVLARAQQHGNSTGGGATPPAGGQFSVQAPNGKTFYFKTAKDMNNFKITAGIR